MKKLQTRIGTTILQQIKDNWIIVAGVAAAGWTFYQFTINRSIPVNISVNLATEIDPKSKLETVAAAAEAKQAVPVKIKVNVENKSDWRELAIRDPIWIAYGFRIGAPVDSHGKPINAMKPEDLKNNINKTFGSSYNSMDHVKTVGDRRLISYSYTKELVGAGVLLGDNEIRPKETLHTEHILAVTRGDYDFVQIRVFIPSLNYSPIYEQIKAPLTIMEHIDGYEPQVKFCSLSERSDECALLSKDELQKIGAQIHSSVSEIWLGLPQKQ